LTLAIGPPGTGKSFTIAALAVELMSQGKSVLIASKNNQAGNVVADKIEKVLPIERWRMLERVGLTTFALPFGAWYFDKEKCVHALRNFLK